MIFGGRLVLERMRNRSILKKSQRKIKVSMKSSGLKIRENNFSLIIDGKKLEAAYENGLREDPERGESYWFEARATVVVTTENGSYYLNMAQAGIWSRNPVANYQQQIHDASMFPGDKIWLGNTLECYVEDDREYPGLRP